VAAATALLVLIGTGGCTGGWGEPGPEPAPGGEASPSATHPATDPAGDQADYPTEVQEYAELTVAAWAAPDLLRLADLATPDVQREIIELPGPPNLAWTSIRCGLVPGASDCSFYNQDGDRLVLTVDHQLLGEPQAVVAVVYEITEYPDDTLAYLQVFVAAWRDGNLARMHNLAAPGAVEVVAALRAPRQVEYRVGEPDGPLVEVEILGGADGTVVTALSTALLGQPQAIRTANLEPATG
jgi:hypothetical protein